MFMFFLPTIVEKQVHPFMATLFINDSCLFLQDDASCHTANTNQEWFEEYDKRTEC